MPSGQAQSVIPARLVIGVTGHREIEDSDALRDRVRRVVDQLEASIGLEHTPLALTVLSALAEGADRLVADQVLSRPGSRLEVVLPLPREQYLLDFERAESKAEFEALCAVAGRVTELPAALARAEAYLQAGRHIVDSCDVLLALWDGQPAAGVGGTGQIVEYARDKGCPLFWIDTSQRGPVTHEPGLPMRLEPFHDLDQYNAPAIDASELARSETELRRRLFQHARRGGLPEDALHAVTGPLLTHYVRADWLALRYQRRYSRAVNAVYGLAAAAVVVVAFQAIFFPKLLALVWLEVLFMALAIAIPWLGHKRHWHARWIDYRFLAERFRSAFFIAMAGLDVAALRPARHVPLSHSTKDWIVMAFASVWAQLPAPHRRAPADADALRGFLRAAWIEDQIHFHERVSRRQERVHRRLELTSEVLFGLTFVAAILHVCHVGNAIVQNVWAFLGIAFPAIGGALAAVRNQREYQRNAMRSAAMRHRLGELQARMSAAGSLETLQAVVREVEETMRHENEDWQVTARLHILEVPA